MLKDGIIEKSCSEWVSPLVIVRKSSGDLRICVDYRKLNEVTMITSYPLPIITETLDKLAGASYFTWIDMVSGYHQVEVAEEDKEKQRLYPHMGYISIVGSPMGWQEHQQPSNQLPRTWSRFSILTLMTSYATTPPLTNIWKEFRRYWR